MAIPGGSEFSGISLREVQGDKYHRKAAHRLKIKVLCSPSKSAAEIKEGQGQHARDYLTTILPHRNTASARSRTPRLKVTKSLPQHHPVIKGRTVSPCGSCSEVYINWKQLRTERADGQFVLDSLLIKKPLSRLSIWSTRNSLWYRESRLEPSLEFHRMRAAHTRLPTAEVNPSRHPWAPRAGDMAERTPLTRAKHGWGHSGESLKTTS